MLRIRSSGQLMPVREHTVSLMLLGVMPKRELLEPSEVSVGVFEMEALMMVSFMGEENMRTKL